MARAVAVRHHVGGGLEREGGGRAGDVHVEAEAVDAERVLHFHRHGGIGALHVGGADEDTIDVGRFAVGGLQGIACRRDGHLGQDGDLVVRPFRDCGAS